MYGSSDAMKSSPVLNVFRVQSNSVPIKTSDFMQFNHLRTKMYLYYLKTQFVPRSKHTASVIKTSQSMLYREIMAVCSQIHTKHINTLCGQNVELLNVKLAVHIVTTGLQRVKSLL